ncbi:hypothetical protein A2625_01055 [candidate division WOR-1 bacterium RIFCSPHIGHO2_01_FULL_53_15]|uniref:Uncharacterized protein n=1 Tax=candidate division WOR-1 bacterium RIFCSPHIGHO2_01_FULL_53_15 TaxID=1802564 RepID=A0A1F4Q0T0_UNCSA|nr:MAG: hypothetical protein A2625_01055 [candidate division WOR-1 bacterium RIFCSPHIGHO2_01_FULL_53_15]
MVILHHHGIKSRPIYSIMENGRRRLKTRASPAGNICRRGNHEGGAELEGGLERSQPEKCT